jgi:hypothetical protein
MTQPTPNSVKQLRWPTQGQRAGRPWVRVRAGPRRRRDRSHVGDFRSQFGVQVFEKPVGTAGFEPVTP